jgi:minor extracellular protease Epr
MFHHTIDQDLIEKVNGIVLEQYDNFHAIKASIPKSKINELKSSSNVKAVEPDIILQAKGQIKDWGIESIKSQRTWDFNYTGKGVKIAILDTGISPHKDLKIAGGISFVSYTSSYFDDNGHGTHVAGIIAAKNNSIGVVGVAPDASIYAVKVLNASGNGFLSDIIAGIDWAITNKMEIINLSLGTPVPSKLLEESIKKAYNHGILVVAAAGNQGNTNGTGDTVAYPAKYDTVIAVSATDSFNRRGVFSATGESIDVAAPGVNILSTYPNNRYVRSDGTSMAAAFVTGNLALLKEIFPNATKEELRKELQKLVIDLGPPGRDVYYGYGLIQSPVGAERISGKDRFEVAVNVSKKGWKHADTVILGNYTSFADALAASPLAFKYDAPILLTSPKSLNPVSKKEITRLGAKKAIIIGGTGSISENVAEELRKMNIVVERIGGKDRFEVTLNIARELGYSDTAIITNGLNFPDALAIAPFAAIHGYPILLTKTQEMPSSVAAFIQNNNIQKTFVVGGEESVGSSVFHQLPSPKRIDGRDRYEVAANILNSLYPNADKAFVATGLTFADALTGSVLIAKNHSSILLTRPETIPDVMNAVIKEKNIKNFIILGGPGSVQNQVIKNLPPYNQQFH